MCQEIFNYLLKVFVLKGKVVDTGEEFPLNFIKRTSAAFENYFSNIHRLVYAVVGMSCSPSPGEGCNEVSLKTGTKDICTYPNHGACIEHGVDRTFRMIAHDQPAKLEMSVHEGLFAITPQPDMIIGVLEV